MDNFKTIYSILKHLEASLDASELDTEAISPFRLGISRERWEQILIMMQDEGYIRGLVIAKSLGDARRHIAEPIQPEITIKGLEYLAENTLMRKVAKAAKGVVDSPR